MPSTTRQPKVSLWQRLFGRRLQDVQCLSRVGGKTVGLPAEFVAGCQELEITFDIEWPWLRLRLWPPAIRVRITDEHGQVVTPTSKVAYRIRRRHTAVCFRIPGEAVAPRNRLRVQVLRVPDGRLQERFELQLISQAAVFKEVELLFFETYAVQQQQQLLTRRFHDRIEQVASCLQLRLTNPDHASLLHQLGTELSLILANNDQSPIQYWTTPIRFESGSLRWQTDLGQANLLFSIVPGQYRLCARLGEQPQGERLLEVLPFTTLSAEAHCRVRDEATVASHNFGAVNHRGVAVPLQFVAEDFQRLELSAILECPLPDPLLPEVSLPVRVVLFRDQRALQSSELDVTLRSGRNRLTASLPLAAASFADGPGWYQLTLSLGDRSLLQTRFEHRTREQLKAAQAEAILQTLELRDPQLFAVREGERIETDHVFATDEAIIPRFTIIGSGFDEDVPGIKWQISQRLIRADTGAVTKSQQFLTAKAGGNLHEIGKLQLNSDRPALPPGCYAYQFWKRDTLLTEFRFRILAVTEIAPYTETLLRASLKVESARLLAVACGSHYESSDIPDSTEFIMPEFTLRSAGYNRHLPQWRTELQLDWESPAGDRRELGRFPVTLTAQPLTVNSCQVRVAGTTISRQPGSHRLLIRVAGRELAALSFRILTCAEVIGQLHVSPFTVTAITKSNQRLTNPQGLVGSDIKALAVSCELTVGILAPADTTELTFVVQTDDVTVAQNSTTVSLARRQHSFQLRPLPFERLVPLTQTGTKRLAVLVSVAGQLRHRHDLTVTCGNRITNFEGQLRADPSQLGISDADYESILRRL